MDNITENKSNDEVNISELANILWSSKKIIVSIVIFSFFITYLYTLLLTDRYSSSSIVAENNSDSSKQNSSYGAIASLAGINLSSDAELDKTELAIVTIKSLDFFENFFYNDDVFMMHLMAIKSYEKEIKKSYYKDNFDKSSNSWKKNQKPSLELSHKTYLKNLSISEEDEIGFYKISLKSNAPDSSEHLLSKSISMINRTILESDRKKNEDSLKYLNLQLSLAKETELKKAVANLIEDKLKKGMMIEASNDYVFEIIDSPRIGYHSEPSRIILSILGGLLSLIIITMIVINNYFNGKRIDLNFLPPKIVVKEI